MFGRLSRMHQSPADHVIDMLYIGDMHTSADLPHLQSIGITHICVVADLLECHYPEHFKYLTVRIDDDDTEDIMSHFDRCIEFIKEAHTTGGKVLVHCMAGMSRSASVCLAFLIQEKRMPFDQAYDLLREKRPIVHPNPGFVRQLLIWEDQKLGPKKKH
eukprot:TRINITY_DN3832_c0_g1_i1.p2 TRINITY_DN3832_c0_g1~~TRINITY_DN3832_c0_g1_i1.p2  ORF type:complete len:159 (+),score=37.17 TRINITY_DN3832_c0_g1_i1:3-479(+)